MNPHNPKDLAEWYMRSHTGDSMAAFEAAKRDLNHQPSNIWLQGAANILEKMAKDRVIVAYPEPAGAIIG